MESAAEIVNQCAQHTNFLTKSFCEGGNVMILIAFVGVLTVLLIFERLLTLHRLGVDKSNLTENLYGMILRGDIKQAIAYCDSKKSPMTNTIKAGLVQVLNKRPDEEVQVAMDAEVLKSTPQLEGWTSFLAVFGNVGVLIGLLGTIFGLIQSFGSVAVADPATKSALLSQGISHALNCTAFGLLVAIIAIVAFAFFQIRIGRMTNDMLESSMRVLNLVASNRDKIKS